MIGEIIQEYLVALGAKVDKPGFQEADRTIHILDQTVATVTGNMARNFTAAGAMVSSAIAGATASVFGLMRSAAKADLEIQKLAQTMMMSKSDVYAMKQASDALGESINDIMLTPELLERFKQLSKEGREMKVGGDFEATMRGFRDLMFEFTRLKQEVSYAMTWVGYYLMKYLNKPLNEAREKFKSFNDNFIRNMSVWTQKAAKALVYIINVGRHMVEFLWDVGKAAAGLFMAFPKGVKIALGALTVFFAILRASPLGRMIALVSTLMILIDDYYGYMEGKSAAFGKYWDKLNGFIERAKGLWEEFQPVAENLWNTIAEYAVKAKDGILSMVDGTGKLIDRIGNSEEFQTFLTVVEELAESIGNLAWSIGKFLIESIVELYESLQESGAIDAFKEALSKVFKIVLFLGHIISQVIDFVGRLIDEMGRTEEVRELRNAVAELFDAVTELFGVIIDLIYEALGGLFGEMHKTQIVYSFRDALRAVLKIITGLIKAVTLVIRGIKSLFELVARNKTFKQFWEAVGKAIDTTLEKLGKFGRAMVAFLSGDAGKAARILAGDDGGKESGQGNTDWNKRVVYERFKAAGYSDEAIAGIMGRVQQEHNFNTSDVPEHWATGADGQKIWVGGYGMFQWNGGRTTAFTNWAKENELNPQDPGVQADYAIIEARQRGITPERMNTKTVSEAANIWTDEWEVGRHGDEQAYAAEIYSDIKNGAPWMKTEYSTPPNEVTSDNVHNSTIRNSEGEQIGYAGGASIANVNRELRLRFSDATAAMREKGYDFYIQNSTEGSIGFTSPAEDWENIKDVLESYGLNVSHDDHGFYVSLPEKQSTDGIQDYIMSTSTTSGLMATMNDLYGRMSAFMPAQGNFTPYTITGAGDGGNVVINNRVEVGEIIVQGGANATAEDIGRQVGDQVNTRLAQRAQYYENSIQQNGSPMLGVGSKMSPAWA